MKKIFKRLLLFSCSLVTVNGFSQADNKAPVLNAVTITASVSNGDSVTVFIDVTDESGLWGKGLAGRADEGYSLTSVTICNPYNWQYTYVKYWKYEGGNVYSGKAKISDYAANGTWKVESVYLVDQKGNYKNYQKAFNESFATFEVQSSNEDITPPVLNKVEVSPATVNGGDSVTVTIDIEDVVSGVNGIGFPDYLNGGSFYKTEARVGSSAGSRDIVIDKWKHVGGNTYSGKARISSYAVSGTWSVTQVYSSDRVGNVKLYTGGADFDADFQVNTKVYDFTAPVLNSLKTSKVVYQGDSLTVTIDISDDISGVCGDGFSKGSDVLDEKTRLRAGRLGGNFQYINSWKHVSDNIYEGKMLIPEDVNTIGMWLIDQILAVDNAGNMTVCETMISYEDLSFEVKARTTNLKELGLSDNFSCTPNPAANGSWITIKGRNIDAVGLYDLLGNRVSEAAFSGESEVRLLLAGQTSGLYVLHINSGNDLIRMKLLIQ